MDLIRDFWRELYFLVSEMAPYLLLGFLFAGLLKAFMPAGGVSRFMGRRNFGSVFNAALLGVPLPLCSCGVIPTGVAFYRNGATKGATTSFLISTPQTGADSILATFSLLGLPFAIIRPVVALLTGLIGGTASHLLEKEQYMAKGRIEVEPDPARRLSLVQRMKSVVTYGFGELVEDIVKWLIIGLVAAALLSLLIPDSFFSQYIGNPWLEMGLVLVASVPMYICATGSIPLAAVLIMKGISPGAALVFLMAGPATNVATMMVIGNTMGRKSFLIYLSTIIGGAILSGFLINELLPASWFTLTNHAHHQHGTAGSILNLLSTILLTVIILVAAWSKWGRPLLTKKSTVKMENIANPLYTTVLVEGMTCNHCRMSVEKSIATIEGVEEVSADITIGQVRITGKKVNLELVAARVKELGYVFKGLIS
jgi:hypothetical protein